MSETLGELADEIAGIEQRLTDVIYDAVRAQMHTEDADAAKELERLLAKVRRSLVKAEALLRQSQA